MLIRPPLVARPPPPVARSSVLCRDQQSLDQQALLGDAFVSMIYGAVQGVVDAVLSPLADAEPELFTSTERLPAPAAQGAALALTWVAAALLLRLYDPSLTRGDAAQAGTACIATWAGAVALAEGGLLLLSSAGIGPGPLDLAELGFLTGSLSVLAGWRWILWRTVGGG